LGLGGGAGGGRFRCFSPRIKNEVAMTSMASRQHCASAFEAALLWLPSCRSYPRPGRESSWRENAHDGESLLGTPHGRVFALTSPPQRIPTGPRSNSNAAAFLANGAAGLCACDGLKANFGAMEVSRMAPVLIQRRLADTLFGRTAGRQLSPRTKPKNSGDEPWPVSNTAILPKPANATREIWARTATPIF